MVGGPRELVRPGQQSLERQIQCVDDENGERSDGSDDTCPQVGMIDLPSRGVGEHDGTGEEGDTDRTGEYQGRHTRHTDKLNCNSFTDIRIRKRRCRRRAAVAHPPR